MNTSDNPELWNILALLWVKGDGYVLDEWLVLVISLLNIRWTRMTFSKLWQADYRSPTHALVSTDGTALGRLSVHNTACCAYHNMHNCYHNRLLTDSTVTHNRYCLATPRAAAVSHTRKHSIQRHKLYTTVIAACDPSPCNCSASRHILRLLSSIADSELTQAKSHHNDC